MSLLITPVKETSVTSIFDDNADRVECPVNTSVSTHVIIRSCPNHLTTFDGDTSLCGLVWVKRNGFSHSHETSLCQMGNSKRVNRWMFCQIIHSQICDLEEDFN